MHINKPWAGVIVIIVMIVTLITIFGQNKPLPGYVETETAGTESTSECAVSVKTYIAPKTGLTLSIPEEWQQVNKNGNALFVHRASASSIEIQEDDYYPDITAATAELLASRITAKGYDFKSFNWMSNSSFALTYSKTLNGRSTNYIEITEFDRNNIVRIIYSADSEYYNKIKTAIEQSIDSIQWEPKNPIPEEFMLQYSEYGNFEFGIPIGWTTGTNNGAYYAQDNKTGAIMVLTATQSSITYENVSQLDYVSIASQGRNSFALRSYSADKNIIRGTAVYTSNNQQYMLMQYLIANGSYEYSITFECPVSVYDQTEALYNNAIALFRVF